MEIEEGVEGLILHLGTRESSRGGAVRNPSRGSRDQRQDYRAGSGSPSAFSLSLKRLEPEYRIHEDALAEEEEAEAEEEGEGCVIEGDYAEPDYATAVDVAG